MKKETDKEARIAGAESRPESLAETHEVLLVLEALTPAESFSKFTRINLLSTIVAIRVATPCG